MKNLTLILALFIAFSSSAQTTVFLQPHFANGIEGTPYGIDTTSANWPGNPHQYCFDSTYYGYPDICLNTTFAYGALTWVWHLIHFSQLSDTTIIPHNAIIDSAVLHLYGVPSSDYGNYGNTYYAGSPYYFYGTNAGWVYELADTFNGHTVSWNTMPGVIHTDSVAIDSSSTQWGGDDSLDVTTMVADMVAHNNTGFLLNLQNESASEVERLFGSCFYHDSTKHPSLKVTYHLPTTGVGQLNDLKMGLTVYPNPATTMLNARLTGSNNDNVIVNVYNVLGEKVYQGYIKQGASTISISTESFSSGVYMLEVVGGQGSIKREFIKL